MAQSKIVRDFIEEVCCQVKAKKAHGLIGGELIAHIEDQTLAYIKEGMNETAAEIKAVEQMGNPVTVGENLNQIHRKKFEWVRLAVSIIVWVIAGSIALASIVFGGGIAVTMIALRPEDGIAAAIVGMGIMLFGSSIAFMIISAYKVISNMLFYRGLMKDYRIKKKKGNFHEI